MAKAEKTPVKKRSSKKINDLSVHTENVAGQLLTTNQGLKINDNNNSLKAGERGATLLEDFILREKITHFDHERIPERIVAGNFPEWELGLQIIPEDDEFKFEFDLLDPTKLIPEEIIPVMWVGKMTINRNPDNFFAETEQVAFHPGHIAPGIDFSNDPLLQGRLFSYTDTQLSRLGSPNFHEIPINRPLSPMHNNQRDGHMRQTINAAKTSYHLNTSIVKQLQQELMVPPF
jgi:catalase